MARFLKSRYYPVDIERRIIYDDPKPREGDCSLPSKVYRDLGTIGIKGERLNTFQCYNAFNIVPALMV